MTERDHSILIDLERCIGCVACTQACPTRAIRVRAERASIQPDLCIDCGACVRRCRYDAVKVKTSSTADLHRFKHTVAIPSLTLYGQFGRDIHPGQVLRAATRVGFDSAYDMSWMCEMVAGATDAYLTESTGPWPRISVTCPAIVRLIQIRYPDMLANLVPIETPRELAAKLLRRRIASDLKLDPKDIGIFFITPCSSIMNSIQIPVGLEQSHLDGALSIADLYAPLYKAIREAEPGEAAWDEPVSPSGLLWAMAGGEIAGMRNSNTMTVRGVRDVKYIFDRIEAGKFQGVDFIEAYVCPDGCVTGGLTVEGRYAAQRNIQLIAKRLQGQGHVKEEKVRSLLREHFFDMEGEIRARPIPQITKDLRQAVARKRDLGALLDRLPKKDCAACGAPDCETLAEDVQRGEAALDDCVFLKIARLEEEAAPREEGRGE